MMPCSKETVIRLFYNFSSFFLLLFLFLYFSSILLSKLLFFLSGSPFTFQRTQNGLEYGWPEEEEGEEEDSYFYAECEENEHVVPNIVHGEEGLIFPSNSRQNLADEEIINSEERVSDWEHMEDAVVEQEVPEREVDSVYNHGLKAGTRPTSPTIIELNKPSLVTHQKPQYYEECTNDERIEKERIEANFSASGDENFLVFAPSQLESKKLQVRDKDIMKEDIFGDSCTVGSTSKSSSEWRSSVINRDSGTDDPFSSSSRRSCPKWESYTVFQKYDEEMMFLHRLSAQKLHETESLRSIQACPRSISERIVHKLATRNKSSTRTSLNPYHELEAAYVAQICLTWEALNWNYINFRSKRALHRQSDPGCPARIAQEFQQFEVLLQRYIENEPYEHGRRPEVYARIRKVAPKLLLVPEYRDSEDEQREEGFGSRIPSASFQKILEGGIRTFMNFLKADRESSYQLLRSLFTKNQSRSVDPTMLLLYKKAHKKKKMKLEDLRRAGKCLRKRKLKGDDEMQILMALIDLKVVSRVLRMADLSEEQLQWCEHKMGKVRILRGKLQRDSTPLFFPAR